MADISAPQEQKLKEMVAQDKKIAAVKLYREMTGVGLKEAKDAVEALMAGAPANVSTISAGTEPDPFLEDRIKGLLAKRKKIEAIKIFREAHHCGLKEAKDAVDLIQAELRSESSSHSPSAPAIGYDPFAQEAWESRRRLVIFMALGLAAVGGLALLFVLQGGG